MAPRGRKPDPAAIKKAKGNPGRRPVGQDPVLPDAATDDVHAAKVEPPAWLKDDGLKIWNRLAQRHAAMKLLTTIDAETFARYCRSFARWLDMQAKIDKQGLTYHVTSKHGEWDRPHPLLLPADRLEVRLQAFEDRFGLNPAERQRIFAARAAQGSAPQLPFGDQQSPKKPTHRGSSPIGMLQ